MTTTIEAELAKANLEAVRYTRGPAGAIPFVISIADQHVDGKRVAGPGTFRTWPGKAEVEVIPDPKRHQAIVSVDEQRRTIKRDVRFTYYGSLSVDDIRAQARDNFPIIMPPGTRWRYGPMVDNTPFDTTWNPQHVVTVPVTAVAPAQHQTLLVGMDETHYFVSALPEPVTSVADAHELLRPAIARKEGTLRQGEWFFVPVTERLSAALWKRLDDLTQMRMEPSSSHVGSVLVHGNHTYALGPVIDTRVGRHTPLILDDFHRVVRNREVTLPRSTHAMRRRRSWD